MMPKERVAIFIDGSNLHWSVKRAFHKTDKHLDFERLIFELTKGKEHIGTWYVNGELDPDYDMSTYLEQKEIVKNIEKIDNFHVDLCRMVKQHYRKDYSIKGDDVGLSVRMVSQAYEDNYDIAILITGDDDFGPAVTKVRELGKTVINAHFKHNQSEHLKKDATKAMDIESVVKKCLR